MELPHKTTDSSGITKWKDINGAVHFSLEDAVTASLRKPPSLMLERVKVGDTQKFLSADGRVFDTWSNAFKANRENREKYEAETCDLLDSLNDIAQSWEKTRLVCKATHREQSECDLALKIRGDNMKAAATWLYAHPTFSIYDTLRLLTYGAIAGWLVYLYLFISHARTLAASHPGAVESFLGCRNSVSSTGFFDWYLGQLCLAYTEASSGILRQAIFTTPVISVAIAGIFVIVAGAYRSLLRRTDLLVFHDPLDRYVPSSVGFLTALGGLLAVFGGAFIVDEAFSQIKSIF